MPTATAPAAPTQAGRHYTERAVTPAAPRTRRFDIDCQLDYAVDDTTDFLFLIHATDGVDQQVVSESLHTTPAVAHHVFADVRAGHRCLRLQAQAGPLTVRYRAQVQRTVLPLDPQAPELAIADLPDDVLHNLNPTRYCESDHLYPAAQGLFGGLPQGVGRVQAIADWIYDNINYQIGSSEATTTARDVFVNRAGVCRDFAHLGVTFCRALNIPARLVVGYARFDARPPDFHAVFEAHVGGRWVMFDPTRMSPVDELVRIATGRDAKDVAFATIYGPTTMLAMAPHIQPYRAD